uniref:Sugar phosphate transporter domain-containing protein n=1 Tax=Bicosoecida sp. CB-2014 TaxID=1486930 RepID=A0A7S1CPL1_9STRA|mmetsp:Transcript_7128/g.25402  ORF Transcript_7128/g.25402 Transcript_7128/m.25402 type:complete len:366 (+) Transcript_7128:233-1330(+)
MSHLAGSHNDDHHAVAVNGLPSDGAGMGRGGKGMRRPAATSPAAAATMAQGALALGTYALSSSALTFVNKTVLSNYEFKCTFFLLAVQLAFAISVCSAARFLPDSWAALRPPRVDLALLQESSKVSVAFVANIAAGFYGLRVVNLPMFFCVRRTAVVFVLAAEVLFLGKSASRPTLVAVALVVVGTVVAGLQDLEADLFGYACVMVNNAMTAAYLALSKRFTQQTNMNALGLLYLNALVALPLCVVMGVMMGEVAIIRSFQPLWSPGFMTALLLSSALGIVLTWALFRSNNLTSPLATSVTGVLKDVGTTALSMAIFAGFNTSVLSVFGVVLSLLGGAMFSFIKVQAARVARTANETARIKAGGS